MGTQTGAWLLAIGAGNGTLLWKAQLESPATGSIARRTYTVPVGCSGGVGRGPEHAGAPPARVW